MLVYSTLNLHAVEGFPVIELEKRRAVAFYPASSYQIELYTAENTY